jgi:hypothetical protein
MGRSWSRWVAAIEAVARNTVEDAAGSTPLTRAAWPPPGADSHCAPSAHPNTLRRAKLSWARQASIIDPSATGRCHRPLSPPPGVCRPPPP